MNPYFTSPYLWDDPHLRAAQLAACAISKLWSELRTGQTLRDIQTAFAYGLQTKPFTLREAVTCTMAANLGRNVARGKGSRSKRRQARCCEVGQN